MKKKAALKGRAVNPGIIIFLAVIFSVMAGIIIGRSGMVSGLLAPVNNKTDTIEYAINIIKLEAREKEVDVKYWKNRISLRDKIRKALYPKEETLKEGMRQDIDKLYEYINRSKIEELTDLLAELRNIQAPAGCADIKSKFISSRTTRLETLSASAGKSKSPPLAGMADSEQKEVFGNWYSSNLKLQSESYKVYTEAWADLSKKLPPGFKLPPFYLLDYEFDVYEANIKGWLASEGIEEGEEKYVVWDKYIASLKPPDDCAGIHAEFLNSDRLMINSFRATIAGEDREELNHRAGYINEQAWLGLKELIKKKYNDIIEKYSAKTK